MKSARAAALATALALSALTLVACQQSAEVSRAVGAMCDEKAECDERCMPPDALTPGGFCTLSCLNDGDCPADTRCADVEGGVCLFACQHDLQCEFLGQDWGCSEEELLSDDPEEIDEVEVCLGSPQ